VIVLHVILMLVFVAAHVYVLYKKHHDARANPEQREWLKQQGGRFGVLPPMRDSVGWALYAVALGTFVAGMVSVISGRDQPGWQLLLIALLANLWSNRRIVNWVHAQPDYQALG